MANKQSNINNKIPHKIPKDLNELLQSNINVLQKWKKLTPLAQNEWICWTTIVKKTETRKEHLVRLQEDLIKGEKRPCCWPECPHRKEGAKKWIKITNYKN
ncbi:MAG: YdeI/OmpD-associated family protein [Patescibacteria group bacterium]